MIANWLSHAGWYDQRDCRAPVAPIDAEVAVQREHTTVGNTLAHPYQACVRQGQLMMGISRVEKGHEWSSVEQDEILHWPKSSIYRGFVDRSVGPCTQPTKCPANSRKVLREPRRPFDRGRNFKLCSTTSRITADLLRPRRWASRSRRACSRSGNRKDIVFITFCSSNRGTTLSVVRSFADDNALARGFRQFEKT